MARRASVRYWQSRGGYCCWFLGKQQLLATGPDDFPDGPVYQAALEAFKCLTSLARADQAKDSNTVLTICELYLQWIETKRKPATLRNRKHVFVPLCKRLGHVQVKDLTQSMVYAWLDEMRKPRLVEQNGQTVAWDSSTVANAIAAVQTAFNWAAKTGLITRNPLVGMERPAVKSRGRRSLIGRTPEERRENHGRILRAATKAFRPFIICLEATGCRPGELAGATARDWHPGLGALIYHADDKRMDGDFSHKTSTKNKERIILFTDESLQIIQKLVAKHPSGPLFRTSHGATGWRLNEIGERFRVIRRKLGMPHLTAYSYRHTFATAWLEQGKSVDILAELLGNSPATIRKHYSHLLGNPGNLRRQLEAFKFEQDKGT